jgi:hypothetical protein
MLPFHLVNTMKETSDVPFVYCILDTTEGSSCFGHWMWECAIFVPYIKSLQAECTKKIKILLNGYKRYKLNVLTDFGIDESDIVYSTNMSNQGAWQEHYVIPMEKEYIAYLPRFMYLWPVTIHTDAFFKHVDNFRDFYISKSIDKTIPVLYLRRSRTENYNLHTRKFINIDSMIDMLNKNYVTILDVDTLTSIRPQIDAVLRSKVIILEMGSAYTVNAGWFAANSHIIILNDFFNAAIASEPYMQVIRKQLKDRNNTHESLSLSNSFHASFNVDVDKLEKLIQLKRHSCIICKNTKFELINSFPKFPIMAISNDDATDAFFDFNLIVCEKCNCLQLQNLIDPAILYSNVYMNSTHSPSWHDHHIAFGDFILKNTNEKSFLEVGANTGALYKIMSNTRALDYTILDMYRNPELPKDLKFCEGNCETFKYTGFNTVILSHVFEHLYSPTKFIANVLESRVTDVFIAIPNFDLLAKELTVINSQHTFFCGLDYIIYMFALHNYKCEVHFSYTGNIKSNMFKFVLNDSTLPRALPSCDKQLFINTYVNNTKTLSEIDIPPNSFICPAGIYGQYFYYFLKKKENVVGFIDNNTKRHNKKLYGTDKLVYSPLTLDFSCATIIVCDCPYKDEIVAGLNRIYPTVRIMYV